MRTLLWTLAAALTLWGCGDAKKRAEERQRAIDAAKTARQAEQEKPAEAPKAEAVKLEAFWDDANYVRITPDGACPEGLWALFSEVPGSAEEKKANAAKKPELAKKLQEATVLVKLRAPAGVKLLPYDAPKGYFPLELSGTIDCTDSIGRIAIAWTKAQAITPGASAAKQGSEVTQNVWTAEPLTYTLPMKSTTEAKEFNDKNRFGLDARLVLKLGKTEVDRKIFKTAKVSSGGITVGGAAEDWGAGRMVHATVQGVRIATDREKTSLIEKKGP